MTGGLYLGIDGGGTSTRAVLADASGCVLGTGTAGTSNYHHAGENGAHQAVRAAVEEAFRGASLAPYPAAAAFLGLAGIVNSADHAAASRVGEGIAETLGVGHDIRIALTGGLAGEPGIALIAGTGSSCYGRDAAGRDVQVGGWGSLADDAGSASWLGHQAIRHAVCQADGREPETGLRAAVFSFLGIADIRDILHRLHVTGLPREDMARLAPTLVALSDAGDTVAAKLVTEAAEELATLVATAARRLEMDAPCVVLAGGLACSGPPFQPQLEDAIRERLPRATIRTPLLSPAGGAILEALRLGGIVLTPDILHNLNSTLTHA